MLKESIQKKIELLSDERVKQALSLLFESIKKLLVHILPRKFKGNVEYGFEDPSTTGKVLAFYSILYPFIGNGLCVNPNFSDACLKGDFTAKGRVQLFTVILILVKVYFNKDFRFLKEKFFD